MLRTRENTDAFITLNENIYGIQSKTVNILSLYIYNLRRFLWYGCVLSITFCIAFNGHSF